MLVIILKNVLEMTARNFSSAKRQLLSAGAYHDTYYWKT